MVQESNGRDCTLKTCWRAAYLCRATYDVCQATYAQRFVAVLCLSACRCTVAYVVHMAGIKQLGITMMKMARVPIGVW